MPGRFIVCISNFEGEQDDGRKERVIEVCSVDYIKRMSSTCGAGRHNARCYLRLPLPNPKIRLRGCWQRLVPDKSLQQNYDLAAPGYNARALLGAEAAKICRAVQFTSQASFDNRFRINVSETCKIHSSLRKNILPNFVSVELEQGERLGGEPFYCSIKILLNFKLLLSMQ